jgi:hypothetical protein
MGELDSSIIIKTETIQLIDTFQQQPIKLLILFFWLQRRVLQLELKRVSY